MTDKPFMKIARGEIDFVPFDLIFKVETMEQATGLFCIFNYNPISLFLQEQDINSWDVRRLMGRLDYGAAFDRMEERLCRAQLP